MIDGRSGSYLEKTPLFLLELKIKMLKLQEKLRKGLENIWAEKMKKLRKLSLGFLRDFLTKKLRVRRYFRRT